MFSTLVAAPFTVLLNLHAVNEVAWQPLPPLIWQGFVWTCLGVAFGGRILWGWVSVVRGVSHTAPLMYLMPPVAGHFAWAVSGVAFGPAKLAGAGLALAGVVIAQQPGRGCQDGSN